MDIKNSFTFGHRISQQGSSSTYVGSTQTEGLAIGQKVSDSVKTQVDVSDAKIVVTDADSQPNLKVSIKDMAFGTALEIKNADGEFSTSTTIPVNVDPSEKTKGSLDGGFNVTRATVEEKEGFGVFVSLADTAGMGERGFLIADGKIQAFLRGA